MAPTWEAAGAGGKCAEGLFAGVMGCMVPASARRSSVCAKPDLDRPKVLPDSAIALAAAALARAAAAMALEAVIDLVDDAKPGLAPAASGFLPKAEVWLPDNKSVALPLLGDAPEADCLVPVGTAGLLTGTPFAATAALGYPPGGFPGLPPLRVVTPETAVGGAPVPSVAAGPETPALVRAWLAW